LRGTGLRSFGRNHESVACLQQAIAMDPDPAARRLGNRAHASSFGRSMILALAECDHSEAVIAVDAATRTEPSFSDRRDGIEDAVERARTRLGLTSDVVGVGLMMTNDEPVSWLRARLG
jgi:hypothetical protein